MKYLITAIAFVLYSAGATLVYAEGCHHACADGYTYNAESGSCVKKTVSS